MFSKEPKPILLSSTKAICFRLVFALDTLTIKCGEGKIFAS